jgi:hypothetical protein
MRLRHLSQDYGQTGRLVYKIDLQGQNESGLTVPRRGLPQALLDYMLARVRNQSTTGFSGSHPVVFLRR